MSPALPRSTLLSIVVILTDACATTPPPETPVSGPAEWMAHVDLSKTKCADIEGVFDNLGLRRDASGRITEDGLLAELVFSRQLPRREVARTISIDSNIDAGWLNATLAGSITREISFAVSCRDGWHLFIETQSTKYLGDNFQAGRFEQESYFRLDRKGRMVARVLSDATYRTDFQEVTRESSENWYRFEPAAAD